MRRRLVLGAAALAAAGFVGGRRWLHPSPDPASLVLRHPGRELGHRLRDLPPPSAWPAPSRKVEVAIVGSGVAALSCAWTLQRAGRQDFLLLDGPAPLGNAAGGTHAYSRYPQGAHYLPVPGRELRHVRALLHDFGVLREGLDDEAPLYDEGMLVHAGVERVWDGGQWHAGLRPPSAPGSAAQVQWDAVLATLDRLGAARDAAGRPVFRLHAGANDLAWGRDPTHRALDAQTFAQWLDAQGVHDPALRWYFDYCCRDEYGSDAGQVSAWAGVHYFNARRGQARHAGEGAVLTWPQGLAWLAEGMAARLAPQQRRAGAAVRVAPLGKRHRVDWMDAEGRLQSLEAAKVVVATPLFVARRLAPQAFEGLETAPGPDTSPWLVANLFLQRFPTEGPGEPLAWDNVVAGSPGLGWVVATHQGIGTALPPGTVFTAYRALGSADNHAQRQWLQQASARELLELAAQDLDAAYGRDWRAHCVGAELTVHGHAMAVPRPGFLDEPLAARAREFLKPGTSLAFAHADLSGFSVFEEACHWGVEAAQVLA